MRLRSTRPRRPALAGKAALVVAWLFALFALPGAAHAQTCTFSVGYTDFGTIDMLDTEPADVVGAVIIHCSGYTTPMLRLCLNIDATKERKLLGPSGATLNYNLFVDPDHVSVWGSVLTPNTVPYILDLPVHPSGNVWAQEPFYGRIPPRQPVPPGTYTMTFSAAETYFVYVGYSGTAPECSTATSPYKSAPFNVTATVGIDCNIVATPLSFGETTTLSQALMATSSVTVTCVSGAPYTVMLDAGTTQGATVAARKLARVEGGDETIDYQIFYDPARAEIWGDGTNGTSVAKNVGTGSAQSFTLYGEVFPQQIGAAGHYHDTVTATIVF